MGSSVAKFLLFNCRFGVLVEHFRKPRNRPDGRQQAPDIQMELKRDLSSGGPGLARLGVSSGTAPETALKRKSPRC
jgi:hypothetical protein